MWHPSGAKTPPRGRRLPEVLLKLVVEVLSFVMKALGSQRPGRQHGCQQLLQLCLIDGALARARCLRSRGLVAACLGAASLSCGSVLYCACVGNTAV